MRFLLSDYDIKKDELPNSMLKSTVLIILFNIFLLGAFMFFMRFKNVINIQSTVRSEHLPMILTAPKTGVVVLSKNNSGSIEKNEVLGYYEQNTNLSTINNCHEYLNNLQYANIINHPRKTINAINDLDGIVEEIVTDVGQLKFDILEYSNLLYHEKFFFNEQNKIYAEQKHVDEIEKKLFAQHDSLNQMLLSLVQSRKNRDSIQLTDQTIAKDQIEKNRINDIKEEINALDKELDYLTFLNKVSKDKTAFLTSKNNYYSELRKTENEIKKDLIGIKTKIKLWNKNNTINSPGSGIFIVDENSLRRNVQMNDTLGIISPQSLDQSSFVIDLYIPPKYINFIQSGQRVKTDLIEYPSLEFGYLEAVISHISKETTNNYYRCRAQLVKGLTTNYGVKIEPKGIGYIGFSQISIENQSLYDKLVKLVRWKYSDLRN